MTRIVIADDTMLMRQGLTAVLSTIADMEIVGEAEDFESLLQVVNETEPDVVITDVRMPPTHTNEGIVAARSIRAAHPDTGVIALSQDAEPSFVLELFEQGTHGLGYLLKENVADRAHLRTAIEAVQGGSSSIDPSVIEIIVQARTRRPSAIDSLTERERQVLSKIAEGAGNAAIADDLAMSVKSVEKHISSIFAKLQLDPKGGDNRRVRSVLVWLAEN